jgi:TfoX/Sxy family transcriptional regulator of competence genes
MAYDEHLAERIRRSLTERKVRSEEKKMMGGLAFMVDDKMCVGVMGNELMVRLHPDDMEKSLQIPGARIMDFTGRPMKGFLIAGGDAIDKDADLDRWLALALAFNPLAKSSKKKK